MIRGVNKQIIEVNETENEYFDRAILFVKAEKVNTGINTLQSQATALLGKMSYTAAAKRKMRRQRLLIIASSALISSGATLLFMLISGGIAV